MTKMPIVNVDGCLKDISKNYFDDIEGYSIMALVVKKDMTVRATKPKINRDEPITGKAAYVWRMVCFMVSPKQPHQCMPVSADSYLPAFYENGKWNYNLAREMAKTLRPIENAIIDNIDKSQWHGVMRWSKLI